ncbi:MAG: GTPase ObgE [Desulfobacterales bacterium]
MKFLDEVLITVRSGDGGSGCVSFRREKYVPRGGPDGGDGGKGGDVILVASSERRTLYPFRYKSDFTAPSGGRGGSRNRTGAQGEDLLIPVPPGTIVRDAASGEILHDFTRSGDRFIAARGGRGGKGNAHFKSATQRTPRFAQPGVPGEERRLRLELKLLADVGLIGLPNAGKSTLLSVISAARPKIADYPFTTLSPILGVVHPPRGEPFVAADIPGLIAGAHAGAGLGIRFLRHIERTRLLVHVIDAAAIDPRAPLSAFETVQTEMSLFHPDLVRKPQLIALNKMDLPAAAEGARAFRAALRGRGGVFLVSAATGKGISRLVNETSRRLEELHAPQSEPR